MTERGSHDALRWTIRRLLPRTRRARVWLLVGLAVLTLALLGPVFTLLGQGFDVIAWLAGPVLGSAVGRLAFLNVALLVTLLILRPRLRAHLAARRRDELCARHRSALELRCRGAAGAETALLRVLRHAPRESIGPPFLVAQAGLALASCRLARGDRRSATALLDALDLRTAPLEIVRSAAQLEAMLATVDDPARLDRALARFPHDASILREARRLALERGGPAAAAALQLRVVEAALPCERVAERARLAELFAAAGMLALAQPDGGLAAAEALLEQAERADRDAPATALLAGDLAARRQATGQALRDWARAATTEAWQRIIATLDGLPEALGSAELVDALRREAALVIVARDALRRGDAARAHRAVRVLLRRTGPSEAVDALLAFVERETQVDGMASRRDGR